MIHGEVKMTTVQYWQRLDALVSSKDYSSDRLLAVAELLRSAPDLPLLIPARRSGERIHHLFTVFDERNPDATGNRYLICFTSEKQARKKPPMPSEIADTHEEGPDFDNLDERYDIRRRKKRSGSTWQTTEAGELARVSTRKILANMRQNAAIGGLIFNPYDEKLSLAIAKFLV